MGTAQSACYITGDPTSLACLPTHPYCWGHCSCGCMQSREAPASLITLSMPGCYISIVNSHSFNGCRLLLQVLRCHEAGGHGQL